MTLGLGLAGAGLVFLLYVAGLAFRPDVVRAPAVPSADEVARVLAARKMFFDPAQPATVYRPVNYAEGPASAWWPKGESPLLTELVKAGRLPPVSQRVGDEPLVLEGCEGVGRYGGTWYRLANSESDRQTIYYRLSGTGLVRWSPQGFPIVPHVAASWKISPDRRDYTFTLRKGMRWSDGAPVTVDDILYWWEDEVRYFGVTPHFMSVDGQLGTVEKLDERRVGFRFPKPYGLFLEKLASIGMIPDYLEEYIVPAHYLRPFHPRLGDPALIARTMRELRLTSAVSLYNRLKQHDNPEHPRLWPWVYRTHRAVPPYVYVRNPYYYAVDPQGNQLPYLDRLVLDVKSQCMIGITAAAGQVSMQDRHIRYDDHVLLMSAARRNGYEVYHWPDATQSPYTIFPVLNRRVDPARPETAHKAELLNDARFRQALSLAINRQDIIDAEFNGQTEPAQIDPGRLSPYHNPRLFHAFTQYDPAQANRLLDEIGLTRRDGDGFRTFRDGSRMTFFLETTEHTPAGPSQFVVDDWCAVGVRTILRQRARVLFLSQKNAYEHDFTVHTGESEFLPLVEARNFVPTYREALYAPGFGYWYQNGGMAGNPAVKTLRGAIEPPIDHPLRRAMGLMNRIDMSTDESERRALFREISDIAADNLWHISIGTSPPQLVVVKKGLHNVPRVALSGAIYQTPANTGIETYYDEAADDGPTVQEETKRELTKVTPLPRAGRSRDAAGQADSSRIVRWLVWGSVLALLGLIATRHPFVLRRLLLLIPTLGLVSLIVFTLIQLPPGDFLEMRMQELANHGDASSLRQIEDLRRDFHLNEPVVQRYARWLGLYWFKTFAPPDEGLLQGNLGRSMEHNRPVNEVVGDRITFTVVVTFLAVLLTWCVAIPAGIYSAVRPYSWGDIALTLFAFLAMSVPSFLLALLLVYLSQHWLGVSITGMFSPEFASQSAWSWGKFADLLKNVWLPVVVLGLGGTAGMMRLMRANLLDELKKPYVTTARAKGVRPLKLLLKYPVRLALNPFISGIGSLFPQLVSGGAIVAIILNLPMVGPVLLSALLAEDTYLAGSMLMVLSLLGFLGTLVSDLLLLWLDPRIRFQGGGR